MTPEQATAVVQDMTFRPGWKLGARPAGGPDIDVWADIDTVDTSYPDPDGTFRRRIRLQPHETIDVSALDLAGLAHAILTQLVARIDQHENREFLQVRTGTGTFRAPLHPHTYDGELCWLEHASERVETTLRAELAALG